VLAVFWNLKEMVAHPAAVDECLSCYVYLPCRIGNLGLAKYVLIQ